MTSQLFVTMCQTCGITIGFSRQLNSTWECPVCHSLITPQSDGSLDMWSAVVSGTQTPTIRVYQPVRLATQHPSIPGKQAKSIAEMFFDTGRDHMQEGDFQKATTYLEKVYQLRHDLGPAYWLLIECYSKLNDWDGVNRIIQAAKRNLEQNTDNVKALADVYERFGYLDQAIALYSEALYRSPNNIELLRLRSIAFVVAENYQGAIGDADKIIELSPNDSMAYWIKANCYDYQLNDNECLSSYRMATRLDPKNAAIFNDRGTAYMRMKRYTEALIDFDYAIEIDPGQSQPYVNKARLMMILGYLDIARDLLTKVIRMDRDNNNAHQLMSILSHVLALKDTPSLLESFGRLCVNFGQREPYGIGITDLPIMDLDLAAN